MNTLNPDCPSAKRFLEVFYATIDLYKSEAHFESLTDIKEKWSERHRTHCEKCRIYSGLKASKLKIVK
jgi:GT2 family glycosyltransferase